MENVLTLTEIFNLIYINNIDIELKDIIIKHNKFDMFIRFYEIEITDLHDNYLKSTDNSNKIFETTNMFGILYSKYIDNETEKEIIGNISLSEAIVLNNLDINEKCWLITS